MRRALASLILAASAASCGGGSETTAPNGNNGNNNPPNNNPGGTVKVLTASFNGTPFSATTLNGAYLNGSLSINGYDSQRTLTISAINIAGPGTITFGIGNQWSALAQSIDNRGSFSTGFGGTGTLTLTTATLFRVTGTFTFTAYTVAGGGLGQPVITVLNGTFDISNP
jgi:hypothetical protein